MRKLVLAASAVALIAACTGVAGAQGGPERGHGGGRHAAMLLQSDSNNDGAVTRQEFDAGRDAMFARMDANSDGNVTAEEGRAARRAMFEQMREQRGEQRGERRQARWDRQDADSNGSISRDEFLARPSEHFTRLDANNDGQISADERPQRPERGERGQRGERRGGFMGADANNDSVLSRAEFAAQGAEMFQRLDANSDGRVTREEAEAARPHRRAPT